MEKFIVTISREFGSGGRLVGCQLAERMGVPFYDRELIELAAKKSGLSPEFIAMSEERAASSFAFGLSAGSQAGTGYFMQYDVPVNDRAFFAQSAVITELAASGSCVVVGRCAGYILREDPACVNVFVFAGLDDRIHRAVHVYGLPEKGLADKIVKADKGRYNYHKHYTGENWLDARAYDLCINTGKVGVEGAVNAIAAYLEHR